jgi:hypothetical protein
MSNKERIGLLQTHLAELGYRTRPNVDGFSVRLPLFSSVAINVTGDAVRVVPRFGFASRTVATWMMFGVLMLASLGVFLGAALAPARFSDLPLMPALGAWVLYTLLIGAIWDGFRYIITENMVTKIELFWGHSSAA